MNLKTDKSDSPKSNSDQIDPQRDYEQMIQKLEEEARNHIRVEQQLKLHIENLQTKLDEFANIKNDLQNSQNVFFVAFWNFW